MAERAVTSLIAKLGSLALKEANFLGGVETQIVSLRDELEWINSFLRDADQKRKTYKRVDVLVNQVRNLAYDAEDIIDLFELEVAQQMQRYVVEWCMYYPIDLYTLYKFGNQIVDIKRKIAEISANKSKYGIEYLVAEETSSTVRLNDGLRREERRARIEQKVVPVGFKDDIKKLTEVLICKEESLRHQQLLTEEEESQEEQLRIVSIVGMGGLGKTTLAQNVYSKVKNTFDSYAWIYVSQEYKMRDLLSEAIAQLMMLTDKKKQELKRKNENDLREMLFPYLKEKRCLFVFDDVWKTEDWDRLKVAFSAHDEHEGKHQRVLLTTRNMKVAQHANSFTTHELRRLSDDDSFELFWRKVFPSQVKGEERSSFFKKLDRPGRKLVAKCDGLPLAIVVLGGLLSTKEKTHTVWSKLLKSANWHLNQGPQQCIHILATSYTDLPYYLQSCFLYFGLFPEDQEIHSNKLIRLWVAEGFIQERGEETMEDIAEEYLEELIERSMIQAEIRRSDGGVQTCRVHDLWREYAVSEAKKDKVLEICGNNGMTFLNIFRRLAIHPNYGTIHISSTQYHIHSFLCFSDDLDKKLWKGLYVKFNVLRVLDLEDIQTLHSLPDEIGELVLLKYLNLRRTNIRKFPNSMKKLCNLQTLDLSTTEITHIPKEIWKMKKLRHLFCCFFESPSSLRKCKDKVVDSFSPPPRIDKLKDLQTLWLDAGRWIEGGLDKLTNLRELWIRGDLRLHTKALEKSIVELKSLRVLRLILDPKVPLSQDSDPLEHVPDPLEHASVSAHPLTKRHLRYVSKCCQPSNALSNAEEDPCALLVPSPLVSFSDHEHLYYMNLEGPLKKIPDDPKDFPPFLKELRLKRSHLKQEDQPMEKLKKLQNLKILRLEVESFEGKEMICSAGGFAKLQNLELFSLDELECLTVKKGAFPCLEVLTIDDCKQLKMLPDELLHVTTLKELNIRGMPERFNTSVQSNTGVDWERIKLTISRYYKESTEGRDQGIATRA